MCLPSAASRSYDRLHKPVRDDLRTGGSHSSRRAARTHSRLVPRCQPCTPRSITAGTPPSERPEQPQIHCDSRPSSATISGISASSSPRRRGTPARAPQVATRSQLHCASSKNSDHVGAQERTTVGGRKRGQPRRDGHGYRPARQTTAPGVCAGRPSVPGLPLHDRRVLSAHEEFVRDSRPAPVAPDATAVHFTCRRVPALATRACKKRHVVLVVRRQIVEARQYSIATLACFVRLTFPDYDRSQASCSRSSASSRALRTARPRPATTTEPAGHRRRGAGAMLAPLVARHRPQHLRRGPAPGR